MSVITPSTKAGFPITLEKEVPRKAVRWPPNNVTFHIYDSQTASEPVASQTFSRGEYSALYGFRKFTTTSQRIVRFRVEFSNTEALTKDMDLWVEVEVDGKVVGEKERIQYATWTLFADTLDGMDSTDFAEASHFHSFSVLTDTISDEQVPDDITINYAIAAGDSDKLDGFDHTHFSVLTHTHSFGVITGTVSDAQVPDDITIDYAAKAGDADSLDSLDSTAFSMAGHTHTASEVTDFDIEVSNNPDVVANTTHRNTLSGNPHLVTPTDVGNTYPQWNANQIQSRDVASAAPEDGQVLKWNQAESQWKPGGCGCCFGVYDGQDRLLGHYAGIDRSTQIISVLDTSIPAYFEVYSDTRDGSAYMYVRHMDAVGWRYTRSDCTGTPYIQHRDAAFPEIYCVDPDNFVDCYRLNPDSTIRMSDVRSYMFPEDPLKRCYEVNPTSQEVLYEIAPYSVPFIPEFPIYVKPIQ